MKTINTFFLAIVVTTFVGLGVSCDSVSNPDPINAIDTTKTVTIQGTAYANLDETNDTFPSQEENYESAPSGTAIKVVVDNSEYSSGANGSSSYETTVGQNGNYSIDVPATDGPMSATIVFESFRADQTQSGPTTTEMTFEAMPLSVTVTAGINSFEDVFYTAN